MYCEKLLCAGFGGQGVMSLGQLVAYAGMLEGYEVTWLPSYGPEMRGGTAYCCVVVSDNPVGSPMISENANTVIVMNEPSLEKFEWRVSPGGVLLINSSLVNRMPERQDLSVYHIDALNEAVRCGNAKMANIVMLGAYMQLTGSVGFPYVIRAFDKVFGKKAKDMLADNMRALNRGMEIIREQSRAAAL